MKMELYSLRLIDRRAENSTTETFIFDAPDGFDWPEGASIHLGNSGFDLKKGKENKGYVRTLSIMSLAEEGVIAVTTRIPSLCSEYKTYLKNASIGDTFVMFKLNSHMELRRVGKSIVLLSAGVAVATTRPLIRAYANNRDGIESLTHINIDSSGEYIFEEELTWSAQTTDGLRNYYVATRDAFYELLESEFSNEALFYVVGGDAFLIEVGKRLLSRGIVEDSVFYDKPESFYRKLKAESQ